MRMERAANISRSRRSWDRFSTSSLRKSCSPMRNISGVVTREPTAAATALRSRRCAIEYKTTVPRRGKKEEGRGTILDKSEWREKARAGLLRFHEMETGIRVKSEYAVMGDLLVSRASSKGATAKRREKKMVIFCETNRNTRGIPHGVVLSIRHTAHDIGRRYRWQSLAAARFTIWLFRRPHGFFAAQLVRRSVTVSWKNINFSTRISLQNIVGDISKRVV